MQPTEAELRVPESEAGGADEAASTGPGIAHTPAPETGPSARLFRAPTLPREMHGDGAAKSNTDAGFGEWAGRPGTQRGCNWSARSVDRCEGSERGAVPVSILSVCGVRFRRYERMRGGHCDDSLSNQSMFCSKPAHCNEGSRTAPYAYFNNLRSAWSITSNNGRSWRRTSRSSTNSDKNKSAACQHTHTQQCVSETALESAPPRTRHAHLSRSAQRVGRHHPQCSGRGGCGTPLSQPAVPSPPRLQPSRRPAKNTHE